MATHIKPLFIPLSLAAAFAMPLASHAETVKMAFIDPLSGPFAPVGQNILKSWQFIAAKANDRAETIYEISDLVYHVMVLMIEQGISLEDIHRELASRHVIDHKVKQEKMTK